MEKRYIFYIIDEDSNQNEILHKLILRVFPNMYVKKFINPYNAWKSLEREKLDVVIFCEYDLQNFNGLTFIKKVRSDERLKDTYCILMAQFGDREIIAKANQIGVDEFIPKPLSLDNFYLKLKTLAKIFDTETKVRILEAKIKEYDEIIAPIEQRIRTLLTKIQSFRYPDKDLTNIAMAVKYIALQLTDDEEELREIEKAAELYLLPKSVFKDKYLEAPIMVDGIITNDAMRDYFNNTKELLGDFVSLEKTLNILYHIYENFDGSGEPDKIKSWQIPLGARILRVAIDFDYLFSRHPKAIDKLIPLMWTQINKLYDFRIIACYDQFLAFNNTKHANARPTEVLLKAHQLEKGMILSRNIITTSGLKMLNTGTKLNDESIKKIQSTTNNNDLLGHIFVRIESIPVNTK